MFELKLLPGTRNGTESWLDEKILRSPEDRPFILFNNKKFLHLNIEVHKWLVDCNIKYEISLSETGFPFYYIISFYTPADATLFKLTWL